MTIVGKTGIITHKANINIEYIHGPLSRECKLWLDFGRAHRVTPILWSLPWQPVVFRIQFKTKTPRSRFTKRSLGCLHSTFETCRPSTIPADLYEPRTFSKSGDRAFIILHPETWNSLSADLKRAPSLCPFKTKLQTFLLSRPCPSMNVPFVYGMYICLCVFISLDVLMCVSTFLCHSISFLSFYVKHFEPLLCNSALYK